MISLYQYKYIPPFYYAYFLLASGAEEIVERVRRTGTSPCRTLWTKNAIYRAFTTATIVLLDTDRGTTYPMKPFTKNKSSQNPAGGQSNESYISLLDKDISDFSTLLGFSMAGSRGY